MAFPQTPLGISVELQINGTWTDVSTDVRSQGGTDAITISRGITSSGGMLADRGTCSLTLDNNTGKYSSRNPTSPYFGYLGRNTPLRVSVAYGAPWLNVSEGGTERASTPDAAVLDITGDIDVRLDVEPAVWGDYRDHVGGSFLGDTELIGKHAVSTNQRSWRLILTDQGRLNFGWSPDGVALTQVESAPIILPPYARQSVRVTFDVNDGAGNNVVTFYTAPSGTAGPWTQLGSPVVTAGVASLFNTSAPLEVGDLSDVGFVSLAKKIFAAEVRSGINGTVVANPNFEAQTPGSTTFADTAPSPRTWTVTAGALTNRYRRFTGEVSSWPPQWDTGGMDVTTPIVASGILQRYGQGQSPLQSTLRRRIPSTAGLMAYWPMEEGSTATQAASPIAGVAPLQAQGFTWAADNTLVGSGPLPQVNAPSSLLARLPGAALGDWHVEMVYKLDSLPASPTLMFQVNLSGGAAATIQVLVGVAALRVQALASDGTVLSTSADVVPTTFTAGWGRLQIYAQTSGGTVSVYVQWIIIGTSSSGFTAVGYSGGPGRVASLTGTWGTAFSSLRLGHLAVFPQSSPNLYDNSDEAFDGETAAVRLSRVASEQGVPLSIAAHSPDTELVGPQQQGTFLDVLTAAAQADEGLLHEAREFLGLRFRGRASLYNQPSALDLPYTASPQPLMAPLTPVDDDQQTRNDSTVTRINGSSSRSVITTGPLSVNPPPAGVGTYDEAVSLNLHSDDQTADHASWRTHMGTWDEARFPQVNIELAKNPALIPAASRIETGSRIRITPPLPGWLPPDPIDELVLGYTESIAQFSWRMSFACTPYGPYKTGVLDDTVLGRADTDGSQLATAATATDTTVSVTTTAGPLWTPDIAETPFDLRVGGEVVTVTTVGQVLNGNPSFDTNTAGWTAYSGATLTRVFAVSRNSWTGLITTGAAASPRIEASTVTVSAGQQYRAAGWLFASQPLPSGVSVSVNWYDAASAYLSTSSASRVPIVGAWELHDNLFTAPAGAAKAGILVTCSGTPGAGLTLYADDVRLIPAAGGVAGGSVQDAFGRTTSSTWGSADTGQTWTQTGGAASDYSTNGTTGLHSLASVNVSHATTIGAAIPDFDMVTSFSTSALATGASHFVFLVSRFTTASDFMAARIEFTTAQAVIITIRKRIAGVDTQLSTKTTTLTHSAATLFRARFAGVGTAFQAKVWLASAAEPAGWDTTVTDASITAPGTVGIRTNLGPGNTNTLPVTATVDDFALLNPQVFTVTRSVNGVVKAQAAGADVRLATPMTLAL